MLFNSYPFLALVMITLAIYYAPIFKRYQVLILIISSLIFYGYSQPYLLILLALSATINAVASYFTCFSHNIYQKKIVATLGVVFNLLVLAFFKYNKLIATSLFGDLQQLDGVGSIVLTLPLPIGISFYTFQGISLVVDTFKRSNIGRNIIIGIDRSFWEHYKKTFFFITFFPQLVAGPIVKARDFFPQIGKKALSNLDFEFAIKSLLLGFFLKIVIADNLKDQTFWIAYPYFQAQSSLTLIIILFGYSMQIFADFAGYSLIAIGVAALFGYRLPTNFNYPYISSSIAEFWQRWHISLSSWLKEYLYFSLGGNRKGNIRTYLNVLIVMFLGGLWHGAAWSYAVWGLWHGIGLAIERAYLTIKSPAGKKKRFIAFKMLFVFCFVSFSWLLFKLPNFSQAIDYIIAIKKNTHIVNNYPIITSTAFYSLPVIIYHFLYLLKNNYALSYKMVISEYDYVLYGFMMFLILVNAGAPGAFVYFQF
jgi:alginate O-acetyltransferase complex protein AlgI